MFRIIPPIVTTLMSLAIFVGALLLPRAQLGNPNAPMWFPLLISIVMFAMSLSYLVQQWRNEQNHNESMALLKVGRTPKLVLGTLLICIVYSILFAIVGFFISTILFLFAELSLVNGVKKWIANVLVAVIFTAVIWFGFTHLLGVNLP